MVLGVLGAQAPNSTQLSKIKSLTSKIEELESENNNLKKESDNFKKESDSLKRENERLKKELASIRKPPKWVKENKEESSHKNPVKRKKKRGPKKGHQPVARYRPDEWDEEIEVIPLLCPHCKTNLPKPHKWHDYFQKDIPEPIEPIITKYNTGWSWCKCCRKEVSASNKLSHSLYGPRIHGQVCYWKFDMGLTYARIQKLLLDQYGIEISRGVLSDMVCRVTKQFETTYETIKFMLREEGHIHADETSWRKDRENYWLWSFSNGDLSLYKIDRTRSQEVVREVLGDKIDGVLISDFYCGYNKLKCEKQKCWAHLLRELRDLKKKYPKNREIERFGNQAKRFFKRAKKMQEDYLNEIDIKRRLKRLKRETEDWYWKRYRHPDIKRLCDRLYKHDRELYTFIETEFGPTNNNGEREIRPAVLLRKISFCNRSAKGVRCQEVMMSIMQTSRKQGLSFVDMAIDHLSRN